MYMRNRFVELPNTIKKSVADQLKLLSWAIGGVNGYFRHLLGDFGGIVLLISGWLALQFFAHYILYFIKEKGVE